MIKAADPIRICSNLFNLALIPMYRSAQIASWADKAASFLSIVVILQVVRI